MKVAGHVWILMRAMALFLSCDFLSLGMAQQLQKPQITAATEKPGVGGGKPVPLVPALPGVVVQQFRLPRDKNFEDVRFYWWQGAKKPKAVLILADEEARTSVFLERAWIDFLRARGWGVLVLGVKGARVPISSDAAVSNLEQRLFAWVDSKTNPPVTNLGESDNDKPSGSRPPIPLLYQASGGAAYWMEMMMMRNSKRFAGWLSVDPAKLSEVPWGSDFALPPGGIMSLVPSTSSIPAGNIKRFYDQFDHIEEIRSKNVKSRLSFVPWTTGSSVELRDSFARMYLEALLKSSDKDGLYVHAQTLMESGSDLPAEAAPESLIWLPNRELISAMKLMRPVLLPGHLLSQTRAFFKTDEFGTCDLRYIQTVANPKGVMVMAANNVPRHFRFSSEWIEFAAKNDWAIVLMGLKEQKVRSVETAAVNLEAQLYPAIGRLLGAESKDVPLVVYAQGIAATWLQTLMLRQPQRYIAWLITGAPRFPSITTPVKVPPGMIISQTANQFGQSLFHFEDLRRADPYNPVCFLPLADVNPPAAYLESVCRMFIEDAVHAKKETMRWVHLHNLTAPPSSVTARPDPKEYGWFPSEEVLGVWKILRLDTKPMPMPIIAKRSFKTKVVEVPELNLFIRTPGSLAKGEVPKGVICFCTWQQEDTTLINRLKSAEDSLVAFADQNQLAMITWNTASLLPPDVNVSDLTEEAENQLQEKFTAFGEEWSAAVRKVSHEFKIPEKDMLLYGISRGAAFAYQIAMRYPQRFLAVHTHIGRHYNNELPREAKGTFWLVTTGEVDRGYGDSFDLYSKLKQLGAPVMFKAGESLGHAPRRDIDELGSAFFRYAMQLRSQCEKEKSRSRAGKDTPVSLFHKAVTTPPWFGDYINQQAVQAGTADADSIPIEQRIALPTEEIAKAWGMPLTVATAKKETVKNFAAGK